MNLLRALLLFLPSLQLAVGRGESFYVLVTELPLPYSLSIMALIIILSVVLEQVTTKRTLVSIAVSNV